jgi:hypothetical protein
MTLNLLYSTRLKHVVLVLTLRHLARKVRLPASRAPRHSDHQGRFLH